MDTYTFQITHNRVYEAIVHTQTDIRRHKSFASGRTRTRARQCREGEKEMDGKGDVGNVVLFISHYYLFVGFFELPLCLTHALAPFDAAVQNDIVALARSSVFGLDFCVSGLNNYNYEQRTSPRCSGHPKEFSFCLSIVSFSISTNILRAEFRLHIEKGNLHYLNILCVPVGDSLGSQCVRIRYNVLAKYSIDWHSLWNFHAQSQQPRELTTTNCVGHSLVDRRCHRSSSRPLSVPAPVPCRYKMSEPL